MNSTTLAYIPRIQAYYQALGYAKPYEWAQHDGVPITRLQAPLRRARIGIVTTAAPYKSGAGDQNPGAPHNGLAKFFDVFAAPIDPEPDLRISHIAYDRVHTTAEDQSSYFPLRALLRLANERMIGSVSPRYYGLPTNRSQWATRQKDTPDLVALCQADRLDGAVLVPNCPVCHQSVAIAAHGLETAGIPTVIMGCARDLIEHVGVPRLLFNNFPLGNGAGLPHDRESQYQIARLATAMLETAHCARSTVQSPFTWSAENNWQKDYSNADLLDTQEIAKRRAAFDAVKVDAKGVKAL